MLSYIGAALRCSVVTLVLCGFVYPLAVTGVGQILLSEQAKGSLEMNAEGKIIGSRLIGQQWSDPQWFHGRPSATTDLSDPTKAAPYNAANTSASNLGPTSKALAERLMEDRKSLEQIQPEAAGKVLPSDSLTTSASGLDPDISPANASLQVARVARARGVQPDQVADLVRQHTASRVLGVFGEPRVNVLELNVALERAFPRR